MSEEEEEAKETEALLDKAIQQRLKDLGIEGLKKLLGDEYYVTKKEQIQEPEAKTEETPAYTATCGTCGRKLTENDLTAGACPACGGPSYDRNSATAD